MSSEVERLAAHPGAEKIAAELTEIQREAVILWTEDAESSVINRHIRISSLIGQITDADVHHIKSLGLATKGSIYKRETSQLTPLGIAVRDYLLSQGAPS